MFCRLQRDVVFFVCVCMFAVRTPSGEESPTHPGCAAGVLAFVAPFHAFPLFYGGAQKYFAAEKHGVVFVRNINSCEHMFYFAPSRVERPIA